MHIEGSDAYLINVILKISWLSNDWSHTHSHFRDGQKLEENLTPHCHIFFIVCVCVCVCVCVRQLMK